MSIEQYLCGRVMCTCSINTEPVVLTACGREVGGDTKSSKIKKDPLKAAKHNFLKAKDYFLPSFPQQL